MINTKKLYKAIGLFSTLLLLVGCNNPFWSDDASYREERWITTTNIDGTQKNYITSGFDKAYIIPATTTNSQESIVIDNGEYIKRINIDGSNEQYIAYHLSNTSNFNSDRSLFVCSYRGEIHVSDLTRDNSSIISEEDEALSYRDPSFSSDNTKIIYSSMEDSEYVSIISYDIATKVNQELYRMDSEQPGNWYIEVMKPYLVENKLIYKKVYRKQFDGGPSKLVSELHLYDLDNDSLSVIYDDEFIYDFKLNYNTGNILIQSEANILTNINSTTSSSLLPFDISGSTRTIFSNSGRYILTDLLVYDLELSLSYEVDLLNIDMNLSEDTIVGTCLRTVKY